ncbi:unnamed protein product [Peronospora farinosa]|uniref:Uncharacterized protein n=1 Tax=Peronospora farinosa TaxID=134698 RepID=A0AAV0T6S5_9STRA|nr:unnamed protein product [Peronospora farinosa]CAI5716019.1 unnamed protein product [Peronospora farinosa]
MPPVQSHQLVRLRSREFTDIIRKQKDRLSSRWTLQNIALIEQNFRYFQIDNKRKLSLKKVLDQCDVKTTFVVVSKYVQECFKHLKEFYGGLATLFPGTSTVESVFFIVK